MTTKTKTQTKTQVQTTEIPTEYQPLCNQLRSLWAKRAMGGAKDAYPIGVQVRGIIDRAGTYGRGLVKLLAGEFGVTAALLYSYATVPAAWTSEAFEAATAERNAKGQPLTFSHFVELAKAEPAAREQLFKRALLDPMSVRDLKDAVAAKRKKPKSKKDLDAGGVIGRLMSSSKAVLDKTTTDKDLLERLTGQPRNETGREPTRDQIETLIETCSAIEANQIFMRVQLEMLLRSSSAGAPKAISAGRERTPSARSASHPAVANGASDHAE